MSLSYCVVDPSQTTADVQRYLDELAGLPADAPAERIVRALLTRSADRLHKLCTRLLYRSYPRLADGPVNLQPDEMLSAVVERLIKCMRQIRPTTVRQFFALANQHMRWELNEVARHVDEQAAVAELRESQFISPPPVDPATSGADVRPSPTVSRVLATMEGLPNEEREAFELVRLQGMAYPDAASVLGCSTKTVRRRLNRALVLLYAQLQDLAPDAALRVPDDAVGHA